MNIVRAIILVLVFFSMNIFVPAGAQANGATVAASVMFGRIHNHCPEPTDWAAIVKESMRRGTVELLKTAAKKLRGTDAEKWEPALERLARGAKNVDIPPHGKGGISREMAEVLAIYIEFSETDVPKTPNPENLPPWFLENAEKLYLANKKLASAIGVEIPCFEDFALMHSGYYRSQEYDFRAVKIMGSLALVIGILCIVTIVRDKKEV